MSQSSAVQYVNLSLETQLGLYIWNYLITVHPQLRGGRHSRGPSGDSWLLENRICRPTARHRSPEEMSYLKKRRAIDATFSGIFRLVRNDKCLVTAAFPDRAHNVPPERRDFAKIPNFLHASSAPVNRTSQGGLVTTIVGVCFGEYSSTSLTEYSIILRTPAASAARVAKDTAPGCTSFAKI